MDRESSREESSSISEGDSSRNYSPNEGDLLMVSRLMSAQVDEDGFQEMLESYQELFPKDIPRNLPPIRGIEHHIDFTLGSTFLNKVAYKANPKESKEFQ
ncbi:hypothetical protein CR513_23886, partial [Mucuna pruriens]